MMVLAHIVQTHMEMPHLPYGYLKNFEGFILSSTVMSNIKEVRLNITSPLGG